MSFAISSVDLHLAPWGQIRELLDACYEKPPRDVFDLVAAASHRRQQLWIATECNRMVGMIMLCPHSKGGHLENLAVDCSARGRGLAKLLVHELLSSVAQRGPSIVTLTTRIPDFFSPIGFRACGQLADGSIPMAIVLPNLEYSG